jgi:hypothetical protein
MKKYFQIFSKGFFLIAGAWSGFVIPFLIFLLLGGQLLMFLLAFLTLCLLFIWLLHKRFFTYKVYVLFFLYAFLIGIIVQFIYFIFGGWALFGS